MSIQAECRECGDDCDEDDLDSDGVCGSCQEELDEEWDALEDDDDDDDDDYDDDDDDDYDDEEEDE